MNLSIEKYKLKITHIIYVGLVLLGLSFLGYFYNDIKTLGFFGFGLLCLVLGLWRREYMLYLAFLELCLGSFGYLLSFDAGGLNLPLRILLFVIIMAIWFKDSITNYKLLITNLKKSRKVIIALVLFLLIWIFGILQGYFRGHEMTNIFFDANSYLYLLLLLPALTYINTKEKFKTLIKTVLVGASILAVETFVLFITFTKSQNFGFLEVLYKWLRDFRIGEFTSLKNGAYRIFMQSQIYLLVGFLLLTVRYLYKDIKFSRLVALMALFSAAIYISLSRSLWVGLTAGIIIFFGALIFSKYTTPSSSPFTKGEMRGLRRKFITIIFSVFLGLLLVSLIIPRDASLIGDRFKIGKSALSTRVEQLKPLVPAIGQNPILGWGFGKTLTFKSFDPRVTYVLKTGEYTTFAFEWGYLDIILKVGVLGLLLYLYLIWVICWPIVKRIKNDPMNIWALTILGALLATHMFTPYLNHPLGIGILILAGLTSSLKFGKK